MRFDVVTIFPQFFDSLRLSKIWRNAQDSRLIELFVHDLRNYARDKHRSVDDTPFGGGPGMVMKVEPLVEVIETLPKLSERKVLYASPQGRKLSQSWAFELAQSSQLVVVAGRYEGVDERFVEGWVDESFSVGDYVLSGGELPCMVLLEVVARLLPGVVGNWESVASDSFTSGVLKFPQYTRPAEFRGRKVPEILQSGNHEAIRRWREEQSRLRTIGRRPDLLKREKEERNEV